MNEELPQILPQVEEAFEHIFDMESEWSLEERFDKLMSAIIESSFHLLDRQRKKGLKVSDADRDFQEEAMAQLKMIDKAFSMAKKYGRLSAPADTNWESDIILRLKNRKGVLGDIVTYIPAPKQKEEEEEDGQ